MGRGAFPTRQGRTASVVLARMVVVIALVVGAVGLTGFVPATPAAALDSPIVQRGAGHVTSDALPTVQIDGVVWDQAVVGDRVYAVGEFTHAPSRRVATRTRRGGSGEHPGVRHHDR